MLKVIHPLFMGFVLSDIEQHISFKKIAEIVAIALFGSFLPLQIDNGVLLPVSRSLVINSLSFKGLDFLCGSAIFIYFHMAKCSLYPPIVTRLYILKESLTFSK